MTLLQKKMSEGVFVNIVLSNEEIITVHENAANKIDVIRAINQDMSEESLIGEDGKKTFLLQHVEDPSIAKDILGWCEKRATEGENWTEEQAYASFCEIYNGKHNTVRLFTVLKVCAYLGVEEMLQLGTKMIAETIRSFVSKESLMSYYDIKPYTHAQQLEVLRKYPWLEVKDEQPETTNLSAMGSWPVVGVDDVNNEARDQPFP